MERFVTLASIITCDHITGMVRTIPTQLFVRINQVPVLVKGDVQFKPIIGCTNIATTIKPCLLTLLETGGHSAFIRINGKPVCLEPVTGKTEGTPPSVVDYKVKSVGQNFVRGA